MNRYARDKRESYPRVNPVTRVELDETKSKRRGMIAAVALVVGIFAIFLGIRFAVRGETGWREVESYLSEPSSAASIQFLYDFSDVSGDAVKRVQSLYQEACREAYRIFSATEAFEDVHNLAYVNAHPNEPVTVEPALYDALACLEGKGARYAYLAPQYAYYRTMFYCEEPWEAEGYDSYTDPEARTYFAELARFTADPEAVTVRLLGNGLVKLELSEAYLAYARAEGITVFLDFYYLKDALELDYVAGQLSSAGFTNGVLSHKNGLVRVLSGVEQPFGYDLYHREGDERYLAGRIRYQGLSAIVQLRDYTLGTETERRSFAMGQGQYRSCYADPADGLCCTATDTILAASCDQGAFPLLLDACSVYIRRPMERAELATALQELAGHGVSCAAFCGWELLMAGEGFTLEQPYDDGTRAVLPVPAGNLPSVAD